MIMLLVGRFVVAFSLAVYHEIYPVNFHALTESEAAVQTTEDHRYGMLVMTEDSAQSKLITLRLRQPSFRGSKTEGSVMIRLKVVEKVLIHSSPSAGMINYFKVEVYIGSKKVATVEKTYQDFRLFQNTLINYLKGNHEDIFDVPTLEQGMRYGEQIQASSGDFYR